MGRGIGAESLASPPAHFMRKECHPWQSMRTIITVSDVGHTARWMISPTVLKVLEDRPLSGRWGASVETHPGEIFTSGSMKLIEAFLISNKRWGCIWDAVECWDLLRLSDWGTRTDSLLFLSKAVVERFRELSAARIRRPSERPASAT